MTKQIGMCPIRKAAEGKSALAQEQMGLNWPQIRLRWQREAGGSGVGQDRSLIKHGKEFDAFINGVWSPPKAGNFSPWYLRPHLCSQIPLYFLCLAFANLSYFHGPTLSAPRLKNKGPKHKNFGCHKNLDAINGPTKIWMLLMQCHTILYSYTGKTNSFT